MHATRAVHDALLTHNAQCGGTSSDTPANYAEKLAEEAIHYEQSRKFMNKIKELHGKIPVDWEVGRIGEIAYALRALIRPGVTSSILELGCASGMITLWSERLAGSSGSKVDVMGVELVPGWVKAAARFAGGRATFVEGDMTNVSLGKTFDVVYMADSYEHIPAYRYWSLWSVLHAHTHQGSHVYIHAPTPEIQRAEQRSKKKRGAGKAGQYFEEVVTRKCLERLAEQFNFTLYQFSIHQQLGSYFSAFLVRH